MNKNLDELVEQAFNDQKVLDYLIKNHFYHAEKVIKKIIEHHFSKQMKLFT
jgi:hypothetical protein|tara:strand:- start:124 stop:276 length:153 start_codon:yes stop_codon:yes gene_type:complete